MPDEDDNGRGTALISSPAVGKAIGKTVGYMTGQPYGNLLATIIICGFGWWFWWSQTVGQPAQLKEARESTAETTRTLTKQFTEATQAQTTVTSEALKATAEQHAKAVETIVEEHKDTVKSMLDHAEKSMQRRDADFKEREMMLREILGKPKAGAALTKEDGETNS